MSGDTLHPSHETRSSDASTFDLVCTKCGHTDQVPGGWGKLAEPCPGATDASITRFKPGDRVRLMDMDDLPRWLTTERCHIYKVMEVVTVDASINHRNLRIARTGDDRAIAFLDERRFELDAGVEILVEEFDAEIATTVENYIGEDRVPPETIKARLEAMAAIVGERKG